MSPVSELEKNADNKINIVRMLKSKVSDMSSNECESSLMNSPDISALRGVTVKSGFCFFEKL